MICKNCNQVIDDDSTYCQYCGTLVKEIQQENSDLYNNTTIKKTKKKATSAWIVMGLVILFAIGIRFINVEETQPDLHVDHLQLEDYEAQLGALSNVSKLSNLNNGGYMCEIDDKVYYLNIEGNIVQTNKELQNSFVIQVGNNHYLTAYQHLLIYADENYKVHSFNTKNAYDQIIVDTASYYLFVSEDALYYQNDADLESIYVYDFKTQENKKINDEHSYNIQIVDHEIYYSTNDSINKIDKDGNKEVICLKQVISFNVIGKDIIYLDAKDQCLYLYDLKKDSDYMISDIKALSFVCNGQKIYFESDRNQQYKICEYDLNKKEKTFIFDIAGENLSIYDRYLFFQDGTGVYLLDTKENKVMLLRSNASEQLL